MIRALAVLGAMSCAPVALADSEFDHCLAGLAPAAQASGVNSDTYSRYTQGLTPDMSVIEKLNYQPEFSTPIWDYLSGLVDDERVAQGKKMLVQYSDVLKRAQAVYGVDPATVVAVWGVESNYGDISGKYSLVQALGTLSCYGRRQGYFRTEFFTALRILQSGSISAERLRGSWAGAFGHTQFMPSTYERIAVDFDGDGRRDLIDSVPDALGSTANFLKKAGWQTGQPWGFEVKLPAGLNIDGEGRRTKRPLSTWLDRGLTRADGSALIQGELSAASMAGLMSPAGATGPTFLVFKNFDAIYGYNAAESYGLAIAHLSDRLRGGSAFKTPWPTDDAGTSRAERREIQTLLLARGYDIGTPDGMIGDKTKDAIRAEQQRLGLTVNGRGGQKILLALRAATPALPPVSQATPQAVVQPTANVPASAPQLSTPAWNTAP